MKTTFTSQQEDSKFTELVDLSKDKRGCKRFIDYERDIPKGMTWDLEEYICENPNHPEFENYFNPKIDLQFNRIKIDLCAEPQLLKAVRNYEWLTINQLRNLLEKLGISCHLNALSNISKDMERKTEKKIIYDKSGNKKLKDFVLINMKSDKTIERLKRLRETKLKRLNWN